MTFSVGGRCVKNLPNKDRSAARTSLLWHCPQCQTHLTETPGWHGLQICSFTCLVCYLSLFPGQSPPQKRKNAMEICSSSYEQIVNIQTQPTHKWCRMLPTSTVKKFFFSLPLSSARLTSFDAKSLQAREKPAGC